MTTSNDPSSQIASDLESNATVYFEMTDTGVSEYLMDFPDAKYGFEDLIRSWFKDEPTFSNPNDRDFYEHEIHWLEFFLFMDICTESMDYALGEVSLVLKSHHNKLAMHALFIERMLSMKKQLVM